eukprot:2415837-Prorocentrum_lima.AAC.1
MVVEACRMLPGQFWLANPRLPPIVNWRGDRHANPSGWYDSTSVRMSGTSSCPTLMRRTP